MSGDRHNNEEAEILAELEALGEDTPEPFELDDARIVGLALDAARRGPAAIEALPLADDARLDRLKAPLATLHTLRASTREGDLDELQAHRIWKAIKAELPSPAQAPRVIPWTQRASVRAAFALAAAILLVIFFGTLLPMGLVDAPTGGPERAASPAPTAQIELEAAEAHLKQVEQRSLKTLMSGAQAPTGPAGDHFLRNLREARFDAHRARQQARARRL